MTDNKRHTSATDDWQTPETVLVPSRAWLGGVVGLDPASSDAANRRVGAERYFDACDNGFIRPWAGTVFLNPPGGRCDAEGRRVVRSGKWCSAHGACGLPVGHVHLGASRSASKAWWRKLVDERLSGRLGRAVFLGFSVEVIQTAQAGLGDEDRASGAMLPTDYLLCFPKRRLPFHDATGQPVRGNTHASVVVGLPAPFEDWAAAAADFKRCFAELGAVKL